MNLKHIIYCLLGFFSIVTLSAQNLPLRPCATEITPEVREWFHNLDHDTRKMMKIQDGELYIPVVLHIVGNDNGFGYFPRDNAYQLICELNRHFLPVHLRFFLADTLQYINKTSYYNHTWGGGYQMMNLHNKPNAMNVYIVLNPADACGYAYYPGSGPSQGRGGIALAKSCSNSQNSTFPHEVGHYLSLPHTFDQWNSGAAEFVDGSNCAFAGDYFCDTPADFLDYRWSCPYTLTQSDPQGDLYDPDGSLFMSYSNEPCGNRFSFEQMDAMVSSRINDRPYLSMITPPAFQEKELADLLTPAEGSQVPVNGFTLRWNSIPGALEYAGAVTQSNNFAGSIIKFTTQDTFFHVTQNLSSGIQYKWRVVAITPYYPCIDPDSLTGHFVFTPNNSLVSLESQTPISLINVFPTPANPWESIKLNLNASDLVTATVYDLSGKIILPTQTISHQNPILADAGVLDSGYYIIIITNEQGERISQRLIIY